MPTTRHKPMLVATRHGGKLTLGKFMKGAWGGVKDVANVAKNLAPYAIPLMAAGSKKTHKRKPGRPRKH